MKFSEYLIENTDVNNLISRYINELKNASGSLNKMTNALRHIEQFNKINNEIIPEEYQKELLPFIDDFRADEIILIKNPIKKLQNSLLLNSSSSKWIALQQIDKDILRQMLTDGAEIRISFKPWSEFVKHVFRDNQILMNKWLKYGETIRSEI